MGIFNRKLVAYTYTYQGRVLPRMEVASYIKVNRNRLVIQDYFGHQLTVIKKSGKWYDEQHPELGEFQLFFK